MKKIEQTPIGNSSEALKEHGESLGEVFSYLEQSVTPDMLLADRRLLLDTKATLRGAYDKDINRMFDRADRTNERVSRIKDGTIELSPGKGLQRLTFKLKEQPGRRNLYFIGISPINGLRDEDIIDSYSYPTHLSSKAQERMRTELGMSEDEAKSAEGDVEFTEDFGWDSYRHEHSQYNDPEPFNDTLYRVSRRGGIVERYDYQQGDWARAIRGNEVLRYKPSVIRKTGRLATRKIVNRPRRSTFDIID